MNKISKIRGDIDAIKKRLADTEVAGLPADEAMRLVVARLDEASISYNESVAALARQTLGARKEGEIDLKQATGALFGNPDDFILGAIFHHLGNEIVADVRAEINRIAVDFPAGIADLQHADDLQRLRKELLVAERLEESEIEAELLKGNQVDRRPDADPVAVLNIPDYVMEAMQ